MLLRTLLCCLAVTCAASALVAAPRIVFESETVDLGKVVRGASANATFTFKNAGDTELEILSVKPGCGCTKAEAKKIKLAPGESSSVEAVLETAEYAGRVSKSIVVYSNDPERGTISLGFSVEIVALAVTKPERLNFGSIKVNESRTHLLRVYPGDPKTFAISKVVPVGSHVTVPSFKKITADDGDYWELTVLVNANKTPGRLMEALEILAGPDERGKITIQVYGNVIE